ncbi:MAG TPA: dihydroorotase [Candidatus Binataceae bacterium]|nr:dihydroorotase [Candidatus Binataceae bacterium]
MSAILLKDGRLLDPLRGIDRVADLLLVDGKIAAADVPTPEGATTIDCRGLWVTPGLIDPHVHLRDPGFPQKETIGTGLRAAAAGGFTTVAAMANTSPVNDTPEIAAYMLEQARGVKLSRLVPVSAVTKDLAGNELVDFRNMMQAGARMFSDDGIPIDDPAVLKRALRIAADSGLAVSLHEEDRALTADGAMNAGTAAEQLGVKGIPPSAETSRVRRDLALAAEIEAPLHIAHISTAEAVAMVRDARAKGVAVTCEVTPHHFSLIDEAVLEFGPDARMAPPLRRREDRSALESAIADGTITMIATDHAPHDPVSKKMDQLGPLFHRGHRASHLAAHASCALASAANGIVGLETAVGLTLQLVHRGLLKPIRMVEMMSVNPARLLRLDTAGTLSAGIAADVTVIDPDCEWTVDANRFHSKSRNMPYTGMKLKGKAILTIVDGAIVFDARREETH